MRLEESFELVRVSKFSQKANIKKLTRLIVREGKLSVLDKISSKSIKICRSYSTLCSENCENDELIDASMVTLKSMNYVHLVCFSREALANNKNRVWKRVIVIFIFIFIFISGPVGPPCAGIGGIINSAVNHPINPCATAEPRDKIGKKFPSR